MSVCLWAKVWLFEVRLCVSHCVSLSLVSCKFPDTDINHNVLVATTKNTGYPISIRPYHQNFCENCAEESMSQRKYCGKPCLSICARSSHTATSLFIYFKHKFLVNCVISLTNRMPSMFDRNGYYYLKMDEWVQRNGYYYLIS